MAVFKLQKASLQHSWLASALRRTSKFQKGWIRESNFMDPKRGCSHPSSIVSKGREGNSLFPFRAKAKRQACNNQQSMPSMTRTSINPKEPKFQQMPKHGEGGVLENAHVADKGVIQHPSQCLLRAQ